MVEEAPYGQHVNSQARLLLFFFKQQKSALSHLSGIVAAHIFL
jgi:hypothetical protein